MKVVSKKGSSVVAGVIGSGISPFAGDGLNEAFSFAVGLGTVGSGEAVLNAQLLAGGGEEFGAIGGTAVSEEALDLDAMIAVESDGFAEGIQGAGDLLVGTKAGKSQAGMVVDGDVERLNTGAGIATGAVPRGPDAGLLEAVVIAEAIGRPNQFQSKERAAP